MSQPQPHKTITCQQVLKDGRCTHSGWLRKRTTMHEKMPAINKIVPWSNMYVVLSEGCVYLFNSDTSTKPAHPFSLYAYDKILQAGEILQKDVPWPFKLVPVQPRDQEMKKKTRYFSAGSEREQKIWMTQFKKQMMFANGKGLKVSHSLSGDGESVSLSVVQESVYTDADDFKPSATQDDSDSEGESYNHIDDWAIEHEANKQYEHRPLPPTPPVEGRPAAPNPRKVSTASNGIASRPPVAIPSPTSPRPPAPIPSPTGTGPVFPASRSNKPLPVPRNPPPLPSEPPEDSPPVSPVNRSVSDTGSVQDRIKALNNKPEIKVKPNIQGGRPIGGIKLLPTPNDIGHGRKDITPPVKSPTDSHRSRKLPSPPPEDRRPPPVPPAMRRGSGDAQNMSEEAFIKSIYMPNITKEQASSYVCEVNEDGVYLLRDGSDSCDYVLVVYAENFARKYKINKLGNEVYLKKDTKFSDIRSLIKYYLENTIPGHSTKLTRPYKLLTGLL